MSRKNRRHRRRAARTAGPARPAAASLQDLLHKANNHRERGELQKAAQLCERALQAAPQEADPHNLMGAILAAAGRHEEAARHVEAALQQAPERADLWFNLALICGERGDWERAYQACREVLARDRNHDLARFNAAKCLARMRRYDEAEEALQRILRNDPGAWQARRELGRLTISLERPEEALEAFAEVARAHPQDAEAAYDLGLTFLELGRHEEALAELQRAHALAPERGDILAYLGHAHTLAGRAAEAEPLLRRAAEAAPESHIPWELLGNVLVARGRLEEAAAAFRNALSICPSAVNASAMLFAAEKTTPEAPEVAHLETLLQREHLPARERWTARFALGRVHDRGGQYETAFAHYRAANELKRATITYDPRQPRNICERAAEVFDADFFAKYEQRGSPSTRPIFIVGMPRSGTTLTEQILASHPQVAGGGELPFAGRLALGLSERLQSPLSYPEVARLLNPTRLPALAKEYLAAVERLAPEAERITDKMPDNHLHLGLLAILFPQASFIHCRRHPLDTCLSCYFQNFSLRQDFTYNLRELALRYRAYDQLAEHWRQVLPVRVLEFNYEDLVEDFEAQVARLLEHCGLPWDERCLRFHETESTVHTASRVQVRQPLYKGSVGRWRHYEPWLDELRTALEAPLESVSQAPAVAPGAAAADLEPDPERDALHARLQAVEEKRQAGELAAAEEACRAILAETPDQPQALELLGVILHQQQRSEEAAGVLERATEKNPNHFAVWNNLGLVYLALARHEDARRAFERSLDLRPGFGVAHYNLGRALVHLGRYEEAEPLLRKVVESSPQDMEALKVLGRVYGALERYREAILCFERVLRQDPDDAESLFDLGRALVLEQRHTEAIAPLRRARDRRPDHLNTVAALGAALVEGTPQEAEEGCALLREALTKAEDHPGLWSSLGRYMHTIGDLEEAEACYRQAIERGLEPVQSLVHLVGMLRPEPEAEEVRDLRAAIAQTSGVLPRSAGHFALGAVYDRAGRYEEAWAEYAEGNRLRRGALEYDPKLEPAVTDALAGAFDEELLRERFGMGADSERPVFIFGMPRSGTTLTEQILVSHPQVAAGGELPTMGELRFTLPQRLGVPAASQEPLRKLDAAALQGVAEDYLQVLAAIDEDAPRVTDKMPANFRNLGLMALAFPQARFIHVQRDPVDTCLSCFFQNFNSGQEWSFNLAEAANYYLAYHRLMAHWREVLPVAMYEVRYEDLVADTEASVRGLLEYCGLPWDEQCLSFHETRRSVRTASINQVRRPIYKSSAGRWHHYEQHLQPLLEPLGALAEA